MAVFLMNWKGKGAILIKNYGVRNCWNLILKRSFLPISIILPVKLKVLSKGKPVTIDAIAVRP